MSKGKALKKANAAAVAGRMREFLRLAGPMLRLEVPLGHVVTAPALERVIGQIRPAIERIRTTGAFMNVWTVAGLKRNEVRNASVLAWFLDPKGSHGLGDLLAAQLFRRIASAPDWLRRENNFRKMRVLTEERPIGSTENRIDISIAGPDYLMFIEVKIDAAEGKDQLRRYVEEIDLKAKAHGLPHALIVYLTPHGRLPDEMPRLRALSWRHVEDAALAVAHRLPATDPRRAPIFQFALHIQSF